MEKLTKKQVATICGNVISKIKAAKNSGERVYIENLIKNEVQKISNLERWEIDIEKLIPECTLQNAVIMANAEPDEVDGSLWWNGTKSHFDYQNRIIFMEFLRDCYTNKN